LAGEELLGLLLVVLEQVAQVMVAMVAIPFFQPLQVQAAVAAARETLETD
jgi:hypothetical protein